MLYRQLNELVKAGERNKVHHCPSISFPIAKDCALTDSEDVVVIFVDDLPGK